MSINQRIQDMMYYLRISRLDLAKSINTTQAAISKWINHPNSTIRSDTLENLLNAYPEISAQWLLTGKGEMIKKPPDLPLDEQLQAAEEKIQLLKELNESIKRENIQLRKILKKYEEKGYSFVIEPPPEYSRKKSEK